MPKADSKAGGMARQDAVSEVEFEAEVVLKIEGSRRMQIGEKGVRKVEKKGKHINSKESGESAPAVCRASLCCWQIQFKFCKH